MKKRPGRKPGTPKTGGRKPGSVNKITADIAFALGQLGCDPIEGMVRIAKNKRASLELKFRVFAEIAGYVYGKRRSIEITPGKADPTGVQLIPLDVLLAEYRQLRDAKSGKPSA